MTLFTGEQVKNAFFCVTSIQLIQFIQFNAVLCPAGRHFWLDFRFYKVLGCEPPARYRVIKPARVVVSRNSRALSCYKILPLTFPPSQNGPGGALCSVLLCRNIVCRLCTGTRHRGGNSPLMEGRLARCTDTPYALA